MRISTSSVFDVNVTQLNTLSTSLFQTQQQVSTGRRMLTPADDPAAAAIALQVSQSDATNTQYLTNIGSAQSATTLSEASLQSVSTLLQNIQTTAVQAGNPALNNSDRATLAAGLQSDLTQLIGLANTKDAVGNYLFSGFKGTTQPFAQSANGVQYYGDDGQRSVQVSTNEQLPTSDSGASIFMRIKNGNGTFTTGTSQTVQVSGTNVMTGATGAVLPTLPATFKVDGTLVTVNTPVTVTGNGTGPGTLAASIQAGLTAAGLSSYAVSAAAGTGLQITHTGSTNPVAITAVDANAITDGIAPTAAGTPGTSGIAAGQTGGTNILAGATAPVVPLPSPIAAGTPATFTVDGVNVSVTTPVTVAGIGTGPGTLAAAIQAGLTAAGLTSYSVSAASTSGLQITNNGSSTAVAITAANATATANGIVLGAGAAGAAKAANTGSGVITVGSTANPPPTAAQIGNSYLISFNSTGTFNISGTDSTGAPLPASSLPTPYTNVPYTSGQTISFNGVQFNITGTPSSGDTFTVKPSTNESVFTTISNLITALNTPVVAGNAASGAQLSTAVGVAMNGLGNALNSVLTSQAGMGARMNELTVLSTTGAAQGVNYKQTLSTLQDLDYNKALTSLSQQKTMLQAAQQSFVQMENLTMFNYLR